MLSCRLLSETKITSFETLYKALQTLHSPPYSVPHVVISSIPLPVSMVKKLALPSAPEAYLRLLGSCSTESSPSLDGAAPSLAEKVTLFNDTPAESNDERTVLVCLASTAAPHEMPITYGFALPTVQGYYSGVGDLFSALVLGYFRYGSERPIVPRTQAPQEPDAKELAQAVSSALLGVQQILLKTHLSTLNSSSRKRQDEESCLPSDDELDAASKAKAGEGQPTRRSKRMRMRELKIVKERALLIKLAEGHDGWQSKQLKWDELI